MMYSQLETILMNQLKRNFDMKKWFTSDWHLGDDRIGVNGKPNLFYRPFKSVGEQNSQIIARFVNSGFKDGDTLFHVGDVVYEDNGSPLQALRYIRDIFPKSKFKLAIGNYDEDKLTILSNFFDEALKDYNVELSKGCIVYVNHYPTLCRENMGFAQFGITGHIHGLWKVKNDMINVSVDAWHFRPVSEDQILFCWNAMQKFYDENVFL